MNAKGVDTASLASVGSDRAIAEAGGSPEDDLRAFRMALGRFATGVVVVTTEYDSARVGLTINSFSSLSLNPPLILWSIDRGARSFDAFMASDRFAINVLERSQVAVSNVFASKETDKFDKVAWTPGGGGVPLIDGAVCQLECTRAYQHDGGDHVLIVGRVNRFRRYAGDALLFVDGRYALATEHCQKAS